MTTKRNGNYKNLIPEIQAVLLESVKQNVLLGQRSDILGQRLELMGHRMDASLDRLDRKHEEIRLILVNVLDRLGVVEQMLTRMPDALKERIAFFPVAPPPK